MGFIVEYFDPHFEEWMPATNSVYPSEDKAEEIRDDLIEKMESTDEFRVKQL